MPGKVLTKVQSRGQITLPGEVRREAGIGPGDSVTVEAVGPGTVRVKALPKLTLAEALERYRIEGPIDEPADREAWQDIAARDVLGSSHVDD